MFKFLLHDCQAYPNIGSRNPYDEGKIRQKNEGNMPLMIAAGADEKIVDRDGYTAQGGYEEFLETGRRKNPLFRKKQRSGARR